MHYIEITDCSSPFLWYSGKQTKQFEIRRIEKDLTGELVYWVKEDNEYGFLNFVLAKDCKVVYKDGATNATDI